MFTAEIRQSQNSFVSYAHEILPSSISVSPYHLICILASSFLTEQICLLIILDVSDLIVCISMLLWLSASQGVISLLMDFFHLVGTHDSKYMTVPMVLKGIKAFLLSMPKAHDKFMDHHLPHVCKNGSDWDRLRNLVATCQTTSFGP
jgi:hypothetical protein